MDQVHPSPTAAAQKEDRTPRMVTLASWWWEGKRVNYIVEPVSKDGTVSFNVFKSQWNTILQHDEWANLSDASFEGLPAYGPLCNFATIADAAKFVYDMSESGDNPNKHVGVQSLVIGPWSNALHRRTDGICCKSSREVLAWMGHMTTMRPPIPVARPWHKERADDAAAPAAAAPAAAAPAAKRPKVETKVKPEVKTEP